MDIATVVMLTICAYGVWYDRRRRLEELSVWRHACRQLGGDRVDSVEDGFQVQRRGVAVRAVVVPHVAMPHRQIRVSATARVRPQPRFSVGLPRGGLERVQLGPTNAWTTRPRWLANRWTEFAANWWRQAAATRLTSNGNEVVLVWDRSVENPSDLVAGVELVAQFAGDDLGAYAALAALPDATPLGDRLAARLAPDDLIVEIVHQGGIARTTATLGILLNATQRFRNRHDLDTCRLPWATPGVVQSFVASGAAEVAIAPEAAQVVWRNLELDAARLHAGFEVLRAVVGRGAGAPYR